MRYPGIAKLFGLVTHRAQSDSSFSTSKVKRDVYRPFRQKWPQSEAAKTALDQIYAKSGNPDSPFSTRKVVTGSDSMPFIRGFAGLGRGLNKPKTVSAVQGLRDIGASARIEPGVRNIGGYKVNKLNLRMSPIVEVDSTAGEPVLYHEVAHTVQVPYGSEASEGVAMVPETVASGLARMMAPRYWTYRYMLPKSEGGYGPDLRNSGLREEDRLWSELDLSASKDREVRGNIVRTREWAKAMADPTSDIGRMYKQYLNAHSVGGFPIDEQRAHAEAQGFRFRSSPYADVLSGTSDVDVEGVED